MAPTKYQLPVADAHINKGNEIDLNNPSSPIQNNKKCPQCGKTFTTNFLLKRHLQTHLPDGERTKFKCPVDQCSKEFIDKANLQRHVQITHLGTFKKFDCSFCNLKFTSKPGRDGHIVSIHTLERAYQCEECPSKFSTANGLRQHRVVHTDEALHKCLICCKLFKVKSTLKHHEKSVHSAVQTRNFQCSTCNKTFFTKSQINIHALTHSHDGQKFPCYFCKKRFNQHEQLVVHTRTHTREKPYSCPVDLCQYSCSAVSSLICHRKRHHPEEGQIQSKTWSCYFCSKKIALFANLVTHFRQHTRETPFTCGLCQRKFKSYQSLGVHIPSHTMEKPFKCRECPKCFTTRFVLQRHIKVIHRQEKHFFCKFCSYSTYEKVNYDVHCLRHSADESILA